MAKPKISEAELTKGIRQLLNAFGIFHWKMWQGPLSNHGIADILGIYQGKFLAIEVKTERGTVSPAQQRFLANVRDQGGIAFVARSVEDVIEKLKLPCLL